MDKTPPLDPSFKRNRRGYPLGLKGIGGSIPVDKLIKTVFVLALVFIVLILWVGTRKTKELPELSVKEDEISKLSNEQVKKIDEMLKGLEERKRNASSEQVRALDKLKRILDITKAEGRLLSPEELSKRIAEPLSGEEMLLDEEMLPEEEMLPAEQMPLPSDGTYSPGELGPEWPLYPD